MKLDKLIEDFEKKTPMNRLIAKLYIHEGLERVPFDYKPTEFHQTNKKSVLVTPFSIVAGHHKDKDKLAAYKELISCEQHNWGKVVLIVPYGLLMFTHQIKLNTSNKKDKSIRKANTMFMFRNFKTAFEKQKNYQRSNLKNWKMNKA